MQPTASARQCVRGHPLVGDGLFCQSCGAFQLDSEGSVQMAGRGERVLAWFVNLVIAIVTLFIGWVIWWFIVAPRGQNPGKALVGLRVIRTDGGAMNTGTMFVRGLVGWAAGIVPFGSIVDNLWLFWDKDAQTLHDKVVNTVVVKAKGSEKIVETGGLPAVAAGAVPPPAYAPPVTLPGTSPSQSLQARQAGEIFCSNCGQAVKADAQFCASCGASIAR
jgi:RDD family/zinc-ribbon domain